MTYTYDSLNRLITAAGSSWSETYTFDPFGNLTGKTGSNAPGMTLTVSQVNNQAGGLSYDANGNAGATSVGSPASLIYDVENRVVAYNPAGTTLVDNAYDAQNPRIFTWTGSEDSLNNPINYTLNVYTPSGQKLGAYTISPSSVFTSMQVTLASSDQYFGGRRLAAMDQLGSAASPGSSGFFPSGEPRSGSGPRDTWNFATYWADSATGLDYAVNRYYSNAYGRYTTPDTAPRPRLSDPQSWNMYAYTGGDPVNRNDPQGRDWNDCGDGWVADASLSGPCQANPYGGYLDLGAIIENAIQQAFQSVAAIETSELSDLQNSGSVISWSFINGDIGQILINLSPSGWGNYVDSFAAAGAIAVGLAIENPVVAGVISIAATGYALYKIYVWISAHPSTTGLTPNEWLEEISDPKKGWKTVPGDPTTWERDCPPGSKRAYETVHRDDGIKYNEGLHYDYTDCNGHTWKDYPDGRRVPSQ